MAVAVSAIQEAGVFLYRHPWASSDIDDPKEIIEALLREALIFRNSSDCHRVRANKADAKIAYLTEVIVMLAHSKKALTTKILHTIHQRLNEIDAGKP
jgi:hypothetical protein